MYDGHLARSRRDGMCRACVNHREINMPKVARWIHNHRFNDWSKRKLLCISRACACTRVRVFSCIVWLPLLVTAESCSFTCAVKSTFLVHRAPTTTSRRSTLMAQHIVAREPGKGVRPFFSYLNARNVSTFPVSSKTSAVDRVLRILPRSSGPCEPSGPIAFTG